VSKIILGIQYSTHHMSDLSESNQATSSVSSILVAETDPMLTNTVNLLNAVALAEEAEPVAIVQLDLNQFIGDFFEGYGFGVEMYSYPRC
jgi:hypothetical protein